MSSIRPSRASILSFERSNIVDREFGEDYRDAHFPAGWFVLPFVGMGALAATLAMLVF
jgi:hypothetical protein